MRKLVCALAMAVAAGGHHPAAAQDQPVEEYRIKAAFLFNFAKFVEWPAGTFSNPDDPIGICISGKNPFGKSLEEMVAGKTVDGRPLTIRYPSGAKQLAGCQILFISASEVRHAASILAELKNPGMLTVVDSGGSDRHSAEGAVISFCLEGDKVRFEIDTSAAEFRKLRISSRLLSLSRNPTSHK